jgi:F1F0 ATPase subunit 2
MLSLALATVAGILLGAVFFGGLYLTVRKGVSSRSPALWFFGSLVVRMSIALAGFYLVSDGSWQRLVACLLGFVAGRLIVTWSTRPAGPRSSPAPGARHAP